MVIKKMVYELAIFNIPQTIGAEWTFGSNSSLKFNDGIELIFGSGSNFNVKYSLVNDRLEFSGSIFLWGIHSTGIFFPNGGNVYDIGNASNEIKAGYFGEGALSGLHLGLGQEIRIHFTSGVSYIDHNGYNLFFLGASIIHQITGSYQIKDADDSNATLSDFDTTARTFILGQVTKPIVGTYHGLQNFESGISVKNQVIGSKIITINLSDLEDDLGVSVPNNLTGTSIGISNVTMPDNLDRIRVKTTYSVEDEYNRIKVRVHAQAGAGNTAIRFIYSLNGAGIVTGNDVTVLVADDDFYESDPIVVSANDAIRILFQMSSGSSNDLIIFGIEIIFYKV